MKTEKAEKHFSEITVSELADYSDEVDVSDYESY